MGIQYLNSFLRNKTNNGSIKKIGLAWLSGKVIAIDTSIYLYRFLAEEALLENMYIMLSQFRYYNITPIFVFDGKAPIEKSKLLEKRSIDKNNAEKKYYLLEEELKYLKDTEKRQEICENMLSLKKKFIRVRRIDTQKVQELITAFGATYIEADAEADEVCARLVIKKVAYACLSEDMDLFVYGCPRVIRYLSLINKTVVIYYLDNILKDLEMTLKEFKEICIISGTDYNFSIDSNIKNLHNTLYYYRQYKKCIDKGSNIEFYTWLDETTNYVDNIYSLYNIYNMFTPENIQLKKYGVNLKRKIMDINKIKELMIPEGFIFLEGETPLTPQLRSN